MCLGKHSRGGGGGGMCIQEVKQSNARHHLQQQQFLQEHSKLVLVPVPVCMCGGRDFTCVLWDQTHRGIDESNEQEKTQ